MVEQAVNAELAIRLAEAWMRMQVSYDLWHAHRNRRPKIRPIDAATPFLAVTPPLI
jgi:plasmid maintenance system antidote protein VapI